MTQTEKPADDRALRLAKQLRANLAKRKAQKRLRESEIIVGKETLKP
jgi:hypothetical protein